MNTYMARYIFPVALRLPEEKDFRVKIDTEIGIVRCKHLDGLLINSYSSNNLKWINSQDTIMQVTSYNNKKEALEALKVYVNESNELKSDGYTEVAQYTVVDIITESEYIKSNLDIQKKSNKILERFLEIYRLHFSEINTGPISVEDSRTIQIWIGKEIINEGVSYTVTFELLDTIVQWKDPFKKGFGNLENDDTKIDRFSYALITNQDIPIWNKILLDAKDQALIFGNYSLSIVLSETAFECFLQNILIEECKQRKIYLLPVKKGEPSKSATEVIMSATVTTILKKYIPLISGRTIAGTKSYNKWNNKAYMKRNDIVHKGHIVESEDIAKESFMAVQRMVEEINNLMK